MEEINPYIENDKIELKSSFCVLLDILGFSSEIIDAATNNTENEHFENFYKIFKNATEGIRLDRKLLPDTGTRHKSWFYKIFSDNIIIGYPFDEVHHESMFGRLIIELIYFQLDLALNGFFVRGGWSKGDLFIDDYIVYGDSLIEAHNLEVDSSFPRIILSKEVEEVVNIHLKYYASKEIAPHYSLLLKDEKGNYFINYMIGFINDYDYVPMVFETELEKHRDIIINKIAKYHDKQEVLEKYQWLADYHNYFCRTFLNNSERFLIDMEFGNMYSRI